MPIRRLPPLLVNQIAAGEVIERPASVVKELVENSIDAGARSVQVAVEAGGRDLIRVSDNGCGIPRDELPLAVAPHATSKLTSTDDLSAIGTLGFRGEALASIASVSRLRLVSRATTDGRAEESGYALEAGADRVSAVQPVGCSPGTVIEVRDLFFNTPARRKFLRAETTEFGHITETLTRLAMIWPQVGLTLRHNDRVALELPPDQTRRQRCLELLGKDLDEALLEFEAETPSHDEAEAFHVWGLAGLPAIARPVARHQYLCLNGRPIRDRQVAHAVKEAYRGLLPPDRQAVAVVMLDVPPTAVDVNVHPTKAEVRFRDPQRIHGLVLSAMRQRLLGGDLTPKATFAAPTLELLEVPSAADERPLPTATTQPTPLAPPPRLGPEMFDPVPQTSSLSAHAFIDYFKRMDPSQKGFVYQEVRQAMRDDDTLEEPAGETMPRSQPELSGSRVLQVHKSYLVTQDDDGLLIVDQHALHERIMFEELSRRILRGDLESQRLLMPATLPATAKRMATLEKLQPLLRRIGVEAEPIGPASIGVHAFATFLFDRKVEPAAFLDELLDRAEDGQFDTDASNAEEAALHEVLDMMACKAAVKAGDAMTPAEWSALLARRNEVERGSNCPHGRPTAIRLTLRDLERQFKRT